MSILLKVLKERHRQLMEKLGESEQQHNRGLSALLLEELEMLETRFRHLADTFAPYLTEKIEITYELESETLSFEGFAFESGPEEDLYVDIEPSDDESDEEED
jgi:hypothetical protein